MFATFLRFELRYRLRQPAVYIFSVIFALLCFGAMTSDAIVIGGGAGQTSINAPFVITQMLGIMSAVSVILVTAFVSTAIVRDFELGTDALFFTKPIHKRDLLAGRFVGAVLVAAIVMVAAAVGLAVGAQPAGDGLVLLRDRYAHPPRAPSLCGSGGVLRGVLRRRLVHKRPR